MSASSTSTEPTIDVTQTPPIPYTGLVLVELRKMVDTRAGRWLLVATTAVTALVLVIQLWVGVAQDLALTMQDFMVGMNTPMGVFLPVLGVLSVSSEWGQRTALVTFSLVPSRMRAIGAKLVSVLMIAVFAVLLGLGLAYAANAAFANLADAKAVWDVDTVGVGQYLLLHAIGMATGFALGALLLNTAGAIAVYSVWAFVLPGLFALGAALIQWFRDLQPWVDYSLTQQWLVDTIDLTGRQWLQLGVTHSLWLALPLALGLWRVARAEVK